MATDPATGLPIYGGTATTGSTPTTGGTAAPVATPAATPAATTPTPAGPQDLGISAGPPTTAGPATIPQTPGVGENFALLDPAVVDKIVPGGFSVPGQAAAAPRPYDEHELVQELATELKVSKGGNQEAKVVAALAMKYGVQVPRTTQGTGHKQGAVGGLRHDIASWFDDVSNDADRAWNASNKGPGGKNPIAQVGTRSGQPKGSDATVPDESAKALQEMFAKVAKKLGVPDAMQNQKGFAEVATKEGQGTGTTGTPAASGRPQTAADVFHAFQATAFATGANGQTTLTANGKAIAQDLVNAGMLDATQANDASAIEGKYAQAINTAVTHNASISDTLAAGVYAGRQNVPAPADEWASYVQGVADEMGVGLTPQQINDIATQYENQATAGGVTSIAQGPSAETDAIKNSVVSLYDPTGTNNPAGVADQMFQGIKQAALAYGIPLTDQQLGTYVQKALQGATVASMYTAKQSAIDQYTTLFQQQAKGLYPTLAPQIDAGMDVTTLIQPYNQITAAYTGKDVATLQAPGTDPTSPLYAFLQGGKDPKSGAPTMMTMDQWKQKLMSDPQYGFQNTQGAKNMASIFSSALLNEFGLVNTGQVGSNFPTSSVITSANS